ncbi:hypothetical protein NC995_17795 [Leptolyngbya sp. FACHB-1515]
MLKLQDLKAEAQSSWETLNLLDGTELTAEAFQVVMRKFGDLRHRSTWERICIQLEALWLLKGLENCDLIRTLAAPDTPIAQAYPAELLDAVLAHPSGLAQVKNGLQQLYSDPLTESDRICAMQFLKRISGYETIDLDLPEISLQAA